VQCLNEEDTDYCVVGLHVKLRTKKPSGNESPLCS
jgi:hypothetical protein